MLLCRLAKRMFSEPSQMMMLLTGSADWRAASASGDFPEMATRRMAAFDDTVIRVYTVCQDSGWLDVE
jgi:hypothetical protein